MTEDGVLGNIHKYVDGDWVVTGLAGDPRMSIVSSKDFAENFVQKYPRPVDEDRIDPPKPEPTPNSVA